MMDRYVTGRSTGRVSRGGGLRTSGAVRALEGCTGSAGGIGLSLASLASLLLLLAAALVRPLLVLGNQLQQLSLCTHGTE